MIILAFSISEYFVPYFAVCLQSLKEHIGPENRYTIVILENGLSDVSKKEIENIIYSDNVCIRYLNLHDKIKSTDFQLHSHVTKETFFKLYIPEILKEYNKVLFCDADILFQDDPAKLFKLHLGKYKIAAAKCHLWNGIVNNDKKAYEYTKSKLAIKNIDNYFQCGVLLFNNKTITHQDINKLIAKAKKSSFICLDQDVLNNYFQDDVYIFSSKWNYETSQKTFRITSIPYMSLEHKKEWKNAEKSPSIIHFSGREKPWFYPDEEYANLWWSYVQKTRYYTKISDRLDAYLIVNNEMRQLRGEFTEIHFPNINTRFATNEYNLRLLYILNNLTKYQYQYFILAIKKKLIYGKHRNEYLRKYNMLKKLIKDAKQLRRSLECTEN